MDNDLNIIEVYLQKYGQMIILLLGMPTSNKSAIAKELLIDIEPKFTLININDYLEKKFINVEVKNIKYKLYDHPDNIDYNRLLNDININKSSGVIVYGNFLNIDIIKDLVIDFSYFFDVRHNFLKNNLIKKKLLPYDDEIENISSINSTNTKTDKTTSDNTKTDKTISDNTITDNTTSDNTTSDNTTSDNTTSDNTTSDNTTSDNTTSDNTLKNIYEKKINRKLEIYISFILLPIYDNIKKNIKFNKYYNIKEDTDFNEIYNNLFDQFIYLIKKKLNQPIESDELNSSETYLERNKKKYLFKISN
jgi:hypothetical protein